MGERVIVPRRPQTTAAVAAHYDDLDPFYRDIWGEHVHHGYWADGRTPDADAAVALVDLLAERLGVAAGQSLCDIGCGYGAAARHLAVRFAVSVSGVTLSSAQARVATAHPPPPRGQVRVAVRDWLDNDFADASFDRAYAIESSEHMADKQRFFDQAWRTLRPGGRLGVCAWLAAERLAADRLAADRPRGWQVRHLLEPICREGRLPGLGSEAEYRRMAERAGFSVVGVEDLSARVRRTWTLCARRLLHRLATQRRYRRFLFDRTATNRVFALTVPRLLLAYRTGALRYGLLICERA